MSVRHITAFATDNITIDGLTRGPALGWSWDGAALSHPMGIRLILAADAKARVIAAITAAVPADVQRLTGLQMQQLPEAQRTEWQAGIRDGDRGGAHYAWDIVGDVGVYIRSTEPIPGECDVDTAEITVVKGV